MLAGVQGAEKNKTKTKEKETQKDWSPNNCDIR